MSDYHILNRTQIAGQWHYEIVAHIITPAGDNSAGVSWVDCIMEDDFITKDSVLPGIAQLELTAIRAGQVVEDVVHWAIPDGFSEPDALDKLDTDYDNFRTSRIDALSDRYKYWGFDRDVP